MSMQDPLADMFTRIRNALQAGHSEVRLPASRLKKNIAAVLQDAGYIGEIKTIEADRKGQQDLLIGLKYVRGRPALRRIARASRPGLRRYVKSHEIPFIKGGYGIVILSTSEGGVIDGHAASRRRLGGELLCVVE